MAEMTKDQKMVMAAVTDCFDSVFKIFHALETLEENLRNGKELSLEDLPQFKLIVEEPENDPYENPLASIMADEEDVPDEEVIDLSEVEDALKANGLNAE